MAATCNAIVVTPLQHPPRIRLAGLKQNLAQSLCVHFFSNKPSRIPGLEDCPEIGEPSDRLVSRRNALQCCLSRFPGRIHSLSLSLERRAGKGSNCCETRVGNWASSCGTRREESKTVQDRRRELLTLFLPSLLANTASHLLGGDFLSSLRGAPEQCCCCC